MGDLFDALEGRIEPIQPTPTTGDLFDALETEKKKPDWWNPVDIIRKNKEPFKPKGAVATPYETFRQSLAEGLVSPIANAVKGIERVTGKKIDTSISPAIDLMEDPAIIAGKQKYPIIDIAAQIPGKSVPYILGGATPLVWGGIGAGEEALEQFRTGKYNAGRVAVQGVGSALLAKAFNAGALDWKTGANNLLAKSPEWLKALIPGLEKLTSKDITKATTTIAQRFFQRSAAVAPISFTESVARDVVSGEKPNYPRAFLNTAIQVGVMAIVAAAYEVPQFQKMIMEEGTRLSKYRTKFFEKTTSPASPAEALEVIKEKLMTDPEQLSPAFRAAAKKASDNIELGRISIRAKELGINESLLRQILISKNKLQRLDTIDAYIRGKLGPGEEFSFKDPTSLGPQLSKLSPLLKAQLQTLINYRKLISEGCDPYDILIATGLTGQESKTSISQQINPSLIYKTYKATGKPIGDVALEQGIIIENTVNPKYVEGGVEPKFVTSTRPMPSLSAPYRGENYTRLSQMKVEYQGADDEKKHLLPFRELPLDIQEEMLQEELPENDKEAQILLNEKFKKSIESDILHVSVEGGADSPNVSYFFPAMLYASKIWQPSLSNIAWMLKQYSITHPEFDPSAMPIVGLMHSGQPAYTDEIRATLLKELGTAGVMAKPESEAPSEAPSPTVTSPTVTSVEEPKRIPEIPELVTDVATTPVISTGKVVAIVGSRDYPNEQAVRDYVRSLPAGTTIVSGAARGVDSWAADEARKQGLKVIEHPADWSKGRGAGMQRNAQIIADATEVVAFQYKKSRGTQNSIDRARAAGKTVQVITPETIAQPIDELSATPTVGKMDVRARIEQFLREHYQHPDIYDSLEDAVDINLGDLSKELKQRVLQFIRKVTTTEDSYTIPGLGKGYENDTIKLAAKGADIILGTPIEAPAEAPVKEDWVDVEVNEYGLGTELTPTKAALTQKTWVTGPKGKWRTVKSKMRREDYESMRDIQVRNAKDELEKYTYINGVLHLKKEFKNPIQRRLFEKKGNYKISLNFGKNPDIIYYPATPQEVKYVAERINEGGELHPIWKKKTLVIDKSKALSNIPTKIPERQAPRTSVDLYEILQVIDDLQNPATRRAQLADLVDIQMSPDIKITRLDGTIGNVSMVRREGRGIIKIDQNEYERFIQAYLAGNTFAEGYLILPKGMTEAQISDFPIFHEIIHAIEGYDGSDADELFCNIIALAMIGRGDLALKVYRELPATMKTTAITFEIEEGDKTREVFKREQNVVWMEEQLRKWDQLRWQPKAKRAWLPKTKEQIQRDINFRLDRSKVGNIFIEEVTTTPKIGAETVLEKEKIGEKQLYAFEKKEVRWPFDIKTYKPKKFKRFTKREVKRLGETFTYGREPADIAGDIVGLKKDVNEVAKGIVKELERVLQLWIRKDDKGNWIDPELQRIFEPLGQDRDYTDLIKDLDQLIAQNKPYKAALVKMRDALSWNHRDYLAERKGLLDEIIPTGQEMVYTAPAPSWEAVKQGQTHLIAEAEKPKKMREYIDAMTTGADREVFDRVAEFRAEKGLVQYVRDPEVNEKKVKAVFEDENDLKRKMIEEGMDQNDPEIQRLTDQYIGDAHDVEETFPFSLRMTPIKDSDNPFIKFYKGALAMIGVYKGHPAMFETLDKMLKSTDPGKVQWIAIAKAVEEKNLIQYSRGLGGEAESIILQTLEGFIREKFPMMGANTRLLLLHALDTLLWFSYADVGYVRGTMDKYDTLIGTSHKMRPDEQEAFLYCYSKILNNLHEIESSFSGLSDIEIVNIKKTGMRPQLAFYSRLPSELQEFLMYVKNEIEAPVFYKKLAAGLWDRTDIIRHRIMGWFHGYFTIDTQAGYVQPNVGGIQNPEKRWPTPEEYVYNTVMTGPGGPKVDVHLSKTMNDYVSKGMSTLMQSNFLEAIKYMPVPLEDFADLLNVVEYQRKWHTRPADPKLATIWDKHAKMGPHGKLECKVEGFLAELGYKQMKKAAGLVDWHWDAFSDPWVHESVYDHLISVFAKPNSPEWVKSWLRGSGFIHRTILLSQYAMYLDNMYTMVWYTPPGKMFDSWQTGQFPRFSKNPKRYIAELRKLIDNGEMDVQILDMARRNNVVMINPNQMLQNLLDANGYKDPALMDDAQRFKRNWMTFGGLEEYIYMRALPKMTYLAYAHMIQLLMDKDHSLNQEAAGRLAATFLNNVSYMFSGDIVYGSLRDLIKSVLFGADPMFGLAKTFTAIAYPLWKKHHKYRPMITGGPEPEGKRMMLNIGRGFANTLLHGTTPPEDMEALQLRYRMHFPRTLMQAALFYQFVAILFWFIHNLTHKNKRPFSSAILFYNKFTHSLAVNSPFDDDQGNSVQLSGNFAREIGDVEQAITDPMGYFSGKTRVGLGLGAQLYMNRDKKNFQIIHPGATLPEKIEDLALWVYGGAQPTFSRTTARMEVPVPMQSLVRFFGYRLNRSMGTGDTYTEAEYNADRKAVNRRDYLQQKIRMKLPYATDEALEKMKEDYKNDFDIGVDIRAERKKREDYFLQFHRAHRSDVRWYNRNNP